jgi:predicted acylesterase/phospholipase RssA
MPKVRVGLTIAGAISLGAYEGGALAAFLLAAQRMQGAIVVDAITGASAGAITAVLAARCLVRGVDPVDAMVKSWVDLPALERLLGKDLMAPLSGQVLADSANDLLLGGLPDGPLRQAEEIRLSLTVVSLGGYEYLIRRLEKNTPVRAVTHLDWVNHTFSEGTDVERWKAAVQAALVSGANAVGFPPKLLKRSAEDIEQMVENGIQNPPTPAGTWCTDGGTIDNEPFGRVLDLVADIAADDPRLLLLVHPHPSSTPVASRWTDPARQPRWTPTGLRAKKLQGTQSIYEDLRKLEKTNTRLDEVQKLARKLEDAATTALRDADPAVTGRLRDALTSALRDSLAEQRERRAGLRAAIGRSAPPELIAPPAEASLGDLLAAAVNGATGLAGKRPTTVEIVSPRLDPSGRPAEDLLAGEKLGHFFGFLDARLRRSDFLLGWDHMALFLRDGLPGHGVSLSPDVAAELARRRQEFHDAGWRRLEPDAAGLKLLAVKEKFRLARLGAKLVRIVGSDVRKWDQGFPVKG